MTVGAERDQIGQVADDGDGRFVGEAVDRFDVADLDVFVVAAVGADARQVGFLVVIAGNVAHFGIDLIFSGILQRFESALTPIDQTWITIIADRSACGNFDTAMFTVAYLLYALRMVDIVVFCGTG